MAEYFLGLDFGTSGARACVLDQAGKIVHESRAEYADAADPQHWRDALHALISGLPAEIRTSLGAICIDGTSGTLLVTDAELNLLGPALLYNDGRATQEAAEIAQAQFGPTSGLAKRLWLARRFPAADWCFHQADWLAALLTGKPGLTDYHNALKSGYDVERLSWPDWVTRLPGNHWQQTVLAPGEDIGPIRPKLADRLGLNRNCLVRAGTTDSIAAFLASGASRPGEAVTSLGTTLVVKLLSETRVEAAASGVYSHRFGRLWLAGGASNTGGGVLKQFFDNDTLSSLSRCIDPLRPSGLDYYPLPGTGERFPVNDPAFEPCMTPRPPDDTLFLQGLLEGMAKIERMGYEKLRELGASPLTRVMTAGGGARNPVWQSIRQTILGVPVEISRFTEAATGTAQLAREGKTCLP